MLPASTAFDRSQAPVTPKRVSVSVVGAHVCLPFSALARRKQVPSSQLFGQLFIARVTDLSHDDSYRLDRYLKILLLACSSKLV